MLVIEHMADGSTIVKIKKDWHPARVSSEYTGKKYDRHTRGALMYQEIILADKMRNAQERNK